jgi:hypothetical protein
MIKKYSSALIQVQKSTLLALILCFVGCASPLNHIGAFSQASADLANTTANSYEFINSSTIDRRLSDIASETNSSPDESTFKGIITDSNLAIRIKLLRGIESYAKALGDLASADFRKDIDAASKDLYGSLGDLQKTYSDATKEELPLSDADLAVIATAVDAIGTAIAEEKRRSALKTVIIQTDPSIQKAMELVSKEISVISEISVANMKAIFTDQVKAYQHESNKLTYERRIAELNNIRKAHDLAEATSGLFKNVVVSSQKIASAHAALLNAVEADQFTSKELVSEIKELVAFSKSTKEFHDKLLSKTQ